MERNKCSSIYSTPWSRINRVYSTPGICLERNMCYSGVDTRLVPIVKMLLTSGNLKVHERTHTEPLNNKNISLQAMWKDIWMILNLWNREAAGIWSDSIPIPHQISIPQYFKTSEPQYQYQYQYQQNWKPQYQYQYQYHSKPQYLNTWYWYCLCLISSHLWHSIICDLQPLLAGKNC